MKKLLLFLLAFLPLTSFAAVTFPINGGTGISTIPTYGQVLVGNPTGTYTLTATSSLGISGGSGTVTSITATSPLTGGTFTTSGSIGCQTASGSQAGCLSSTDWTTFNGKGSGSVTSVGLSVPTGLSISGSPISTSGTLALTLTAGFNIPLTASTTQWNNLYNASTTLPYQAQGNYITALTGDVTASGPGSTAATLATVNTNTGSWGSSTAIPNFTVNGKGLITAAGTNAVIAPASTLSGTTLASGVINSSLTSVGTLSTGIWNGTTIAIANGGSGQTSANAALNAFLPSQASASGQYLTSNGTNASWAPVSGSGTVNSGVSGNIAFYNANGTAVSASSTIVLGTTTADSNNVGVGTTSPTLGALVVQPRFTGQAGLVVEGLPSQSSDILDILKSDGTVFLTVDSSGTINTGPQLQCTSAVFCQYQALTQDFEFKVNDPTKAFKVTTGGSTWAYFTGTQNFGLGTSSPYATTSIQSNSSVGDAFVVATSTTHAVFGIDNDGHRFTSGPPPAISSCGTGTGTVVGDDQSGTVTTATAATACTMTFSKAYRATPTCTVSDNSTVGFADISSISVSAVTFGISSALTGGNLYYQCSYHK